MAHDCPSQPALDSRRRRDAFRTKRMSIASGHREEPSLLGLVVLYSGECELSVRVLLERLDGLFAGQFLPARQAGNFVVEGPARGASFLVQSSVEGFSGTFMVNNVLAPYPSLSSAVRYIGRPTLRRTAEKQTSWMSVDLLRSPQAAGDATRFMAVLVSALAPEQSAVIVNAADYSVSAFTPEVRRLLARGEFPTWDFGPA